MTSPYRIPATPEPEPEPEAVRPSAFDLWWREAKVWWRFWGIDLETLRFTWGAICMLLILVVYIATAVARPPR